MRISPAQSSRPPLGARNKGGAPPRLASGSRFFSSRRSALPWFRSWLERSWQAPPWRPASCASSATRLFSSATRLPQFVRSRRRSNDGGRDRARATRCSKNFLELVPVALGRFRGPWPTRLSTSPAHAHQLVIGWPSLRTSCFSSLLPSLDQTVKTNLRTHPRILLVFEGWSSMGLGYPALKILPTFFLKPWKMRPVRPARFRERSPAPDWQRFLRRGVSFFPPPFGSNFSSWRTFFSWRFSGSGSGAPDSIRSMGAVISQLQR